jgi:hypothetical protein
MTRTPIPFMTDDVALLARSLRRQWLDRPTPPGHVELLNMLARAAGHRNFQHLRADATARDALEHPAPPVAPADHRRVRRAANHFDADARLASWPARTMLQHLCLWGLWAQLPSESLMTEPQLNDRLRLLNGFGDHAILRRILCQDGLLDRDPEGRAYRRVERPPPPDALALIRHLDLRRRGVPAG